MRLDQLIKLTLWIHFMNRFRQYGLWDSYSELYPSEDLVYTVGKSDYRKDWLFAQVNRCASDYVLCYGWVYVIDMLNSGEENIINKKNKQWSLFTCIHIWLNSIPLICHLLLLFSMSSSQSFHGWRKKQDNTYQGTTWQIKFVLDTVDQTGTYKLRVALASASLAELQVKTGERFR